MCGAVGFCPESGSNFWVGASMGSFDEATAVRRIEDGRYSVELDADYGFDQALNGGANEVEARHSVAHTASPCPSICSRPSPPLVRKQRL